MASSTGTSSTIANHSSARCECRRRVRRRPTRAHWVALLKIHPDDVQRHASGCASTSGASRTCATAVPRLPSRRPVPLGARSYAVRTRRHGSANVWPDRSATSTLQTRRRRCANRRARVGNDGSNGGHWVWDLTTDQATHRAHERDARAASSAPSNYDEYERIPIIGRPAARSTRSRRHLAGTVAAGCRYRIVVQARANSLDPCAWGLSRCRWQTAEARRIDRNITERKRTEALRQAKALRARGRRFRRWSLGLRLHDSARFRLPTRAADPQAAAGPKVQPMDEWFAALRSTPMTRRCACGVRAPGRQITDHEGEWRTPGGSYRWCIGCDIRDAAASPAWPGRYPTSMRANAPKNRCGVPKRYALAVARSDDGVWVGTSAWRGVQSCALANCRACRPRSATAPNSSTHCACTPTMRRGMPGDPPRRRDPGLRVRYRVRRRRVVRWIGCVRCAFATRANPAGWRGR
jgi:hypothetical protein